MTTMTSQLRLFPVDRRVRMRELKRIWSELRAAGVLYNGMTDDALRARYGDALYHKPGIGWFVRARAG
jgi:hypothetical protein